MEFDAALKSPCVCSEQLLAGSFQTLSHRSRRRQPASVSSSSTRQKHGEHGGNRVRPPGGEADILRCSGVFVDGLSVGGIPVLQTGELTGCVGSAL